jgi:site-specific recombinase XerD
MPSQLQLYSAQVKSRLAAAYRHSTNKAQETAVKTLAMFCILFSVPFPQVSTLTLLAYIEFLADNKYNVSTIKNYISACKSKFKQLSISVHPFESELIKLSFKSLENNAPNQCKCKPVFSFQQIYDLIHVMSTHPLFLHYKLAIMLGFMGMLRISNVVLVSINQFDHNRHLARGDLQLHNNNIIIHLKWSKTMQSYRQGAMVVLPAIQHSKMCPIATFSALCTTFPVKPHQPLYSFYSGNKLKIFSRAKLQNMLNIASKKLHFENNFTFHALRRSAASLAFKAGIPLEQIQAHGCWSSEAIWSYIDASAKSVMLPRFFASSYSSTSTPFGFGY